MKYVITLLLFLTGFVSFSQPYQVFKGDTINRRDAKGLKQGVWRKFYQSDTLCSETYFLNDKPTGKSRTYYESGNLKAEVIFAKGSTKGKGLSYYEKGKIMARGNYVGQKKDSTWVFYHEFTDTISAIEIYKAGVADGVWKVFYENGVLAHEISYKKGKKDGLVKDYNMDGQLIFTLTYVNGVESGESVLYYPDGKVREKGMYKNGERSGKWVMLDKNGALSKSTNYVNGVAQE